MRAGTVRAGTVRLGTVKPGSHAREIVKQAQEKGKISFSLFLRSCLRLLHTCEPPLKQ